MATTNRPSAIAKTAAGISAPDQPTAPEAIRAIMSERSPYLAGMSAPIKATAPQPRGDSGHHAGGQSMFAARTIKTAAGVSAPN